MSTEGAGPEDRSAEVIPLRPGDVASADQAADEAATAPGEAPETPAGGGPRPGAGSSEVKRRPIVPAHLSSLGGIRRTAGEHFGLLAYRVAFHAVRLPLYVVSSARWAVWGTLLLAYTQIHWWWVLEQYPLRSGAAAAGDSKEWLRLHREAKETRKARGITLGAEAVALAGGGAVMLSYSPWWGWAGLATVTVPVLARVGRPEDKPIMSAAIVPPRYQAPTPEVITRAFCSIGIDKIVQYVKEHGTLEWVSDVHRDGDGWGVEVDLPYGVTAAMILAKRKELSSGLRRPLSAVWPEAVPHEHDGRLYLWIGRYDLSKVPPRPYPLLKSGQTDIFQRVPFAANPRGTPVEMPMFQANYLIGGAPGNGKTAVVRVLACDAALDPVCDLWIHEFSGKGDLQPLELVSHRYCSGMDEESLAYGAESVRKLKEELRHREAIFKKLPIEVKPDGALTRELALKDRRLRPIVAIFDEVQNLFLSPDGPEMAALLPEIIRLARAYGIIIILATQRPDKDSLPTTISGIVTARFCLKVPDQVSNDMILGTGAYKAGFNAVAFRHEIDAGLGWLRGASDPQAVRTYYLDLKATRRVAERARAIRQAAGVLSGAAVSGEDGEDGRDFLADVLTVFSPGENNLWAETIATRLRERLPGSYGSITQAAVASQLRDRGVEVKQVRERGAGVRAGCERAAAEKSAGTARA